MDRQFELLRGNLARRGMHLNAVSADEHVPKIEHPHCSGMSIMHIQLYAISKDAGTPHDGNGCIQHPVAQQFSP